MDATIEGLMEHLEEGDIIIDGGNEWYENSERRMKAVAEKGVRYMAMGVSGGEEGARNGARITQLFCSTLRVSVSCFLRVQRQSDCLVGIMISVNRR